MGNTQPSGKKGKEQNLQYDVKAVWNREEKLTTDERRMRYKCGDRYIPITEIPRWNMIDANTIIDRATKTLASDAREAEKLRRRATKLPPKEEVTETDEEIKKLGEEQYKVFLAKRSTQRKWRDLEVETEEVALKSKSTAEFSYNSEINKKVALIQGDITTLEIDGVVNAANESLLGGGGIDGAIHKAAGGELRKECHTLGGAETGETKLTRGHNLPAKFILHTVGPRGKNEKALTSCYKSCLDICRDHGIKSVALCGISTGIFGYPLYDASHVALRVIREWLEVPENLAAMDLIIFCTFLDKEIICYNKLMPMYFPPEGMDTQQIVAKYQEVIQSYNGGDDGTMASDGEDIKPKKEAVQESKVDEREASSATKDDSPSKEESTPEPSEEEKETIPEPSELSIRRPTTEDDEPLEIEEATK
eukprot:TRINITY_DN5144_c0_g1_i2.p1 TRINITY_DN5144_c0_g1~~TRINITY_DN5144_c0_g1_i2.p1  ORF type:complete len:421 (+),score=115.36 TRINITY_DN5144_c0_g1_i2:52-1314(+)